ncbi:spore coat protein YsxE [Melghirimyces profundicolus]|uniref:Spore coat protein YsxE n=1 Tax=Melghirimyces profundicolus TaxID=1242148 RepID=A0A2T6BTG2_9BACL|nr:phosphotransferase [Melghirimyces profundicolus]PTX59378.1 spore coat protein YsxE [Melghirimyces profundicolus]
MKLEPERDGPVLSRVFDAYGWSPLQVRYIRGVLRVDTGDGVYSLKKSSAEPDHLSFLHEVFTKLRESGYDQVLPLEKTKSGDPFVKEEGGCWYAHPWYGEAAGRGDEVPPEKLIRDLARFHKLCEPLTAGRGKPDSPAVTAGLSRKKKAQEQLKQWRNAVSEREFASPFEKAFLSHGEDIEKTASFAIQGLEKVGRSNGGKVPRITLIHGHLHPQNLLVGKEGWRWIDFDHAEAGSPVVDVAMFLRRFVPFDGDEVVDPFALLEEYQTENPLKEKERKLLALHLAYPEPVIRTVSAYYNHPTGMEESSAVQRLEEELDRLRLFKGWVRTVWNTGKTSGRKKMASREAAAAVRSRSKKN